MLLFDRSILKPSTVCQSTFPYEVPLFVTRPVFVLYVAVTVLSSLTIRSSLLVFLNSCSTNFQPRSNKQSLSNQPIEILLLLLPFIFYLSRYNTTKSLYFALYYSAVMLAVSQFLIKNLLSQFNKCEKMEIKGGDTGYDKGLAVVGLVVALLALLLAFISYRSSRRFNHPASSLPSPFIKVCPPYPPLYC